MADVTPMRTGAETALVDMFPAVKASLPGTPKVADARKAALDKFQAVGLPHRRIEAWHYTDLRGLLREVAPIAPAPNAAAVTTVQAAGDPLGEIEAVRLTIVDGHLVPSLSDLDRLPEGVEVTQLATALAKGNPLVDAYMGTIARAADDALPALNAAFVSDGVVLRIAEDTAVDRPILIRFVATGEKPAATFTRVLAVVEEGASVTVVENHEAFGSVAHQSNCAVEILAGDKSQVEHVRVNARGGNGFDLSTLGVRLGAAASFRSVALTVSPAVTRHQIGVVFAGEGATLSVGGGALLNGSQHADTTLLVDHAVPHGVSRELFKHVLDGEATGVFQGKIVVRPDAQKTDGKMMSQAVLLDDGASMNNKPELEIFADDVVCAHGATCGALDEDLLFYLRARGLPLPEAEALMLQAFVGEALELVAHEGLRTALEGVVESWLRARM